ncbi:F-box protein At5g49610-like [Papaver somniferum]|uniref:F-box protein At5g49610-like n=1 Tax=Papaver somniferum TaxID=3469 RepID=UPI000E700A42|nr:F-box protein At5g49610-like [Papaver somniferum]
MVSFSSLTDDILLEIFSYLPLNSVYKFKCLSKVWLSNLSNPNFTIKWFQVNYKSLPWIHYDTVNCDNLFADKSPLRFRKAYPELHSEFMSRNMFAFKFFITEKPFVEAILFVLGSSNGLALCLSIPRNSTEGRRYHVCNPLTQTWVSLPEPPRRGYPASYLDLSGIFCEQSSSSFASSYKVVRIPLTDRPSEKFSVDIFSSDLGVWESFQVLCDEIVALNSSKYHNAIILNGVMFWIEGGDKMLVYNLNQEYNSDGHQCSLINLPDEDNEYDSDMILGESEGRVCYARIRIIQREATVSVWMLDEVNWVVLHNDISIDGIFADMQFETDQVVRRGIKILGFSPVDHNVVLICCKDRVWGFNIQTKSFEELCLDNKHRYDEGSRMIRPVVLTPMPTVLPPPSWIEKEIILTEPEAPLISKIGGWEKIKITNAKRMKTV